MVTDTASGETIAEPTATEPTAVEEVKTFLDQAQDAIGDAIDATVSAVKEHPVAAAAIAAGAAAAVGGAAYAATRLRNGEAPEAPKVAKPTKA